MKTHSDENCVWLGGGVFLTSFGSIFLIIKEIKKVLHKTAFLTLYSNCGKSGDG